MKKILIVEDDAEIAMLEKDYLNMNGYEVDILSDSIGVVEQVLSNNYALVILDVMLPSGSGLDICRELTEKTDIPVLMVTAKGDSTDIIRGLGLGADDYITKPFDPSELVARVNTNINRYLKYHQSSSVEDIIRVGNIKILMKSWRVFKNEVEIKLPKREFSLLAFLASNPNIVFTKEQLYEKIWGYEYIGDSATITVHINRIREKIEDDPQNPKIIETVWGAGYRLNYN